MVATNVEKPEILRELFEFGKLREFSGNVEPQGKIIKLRSNICVKQLLTG